LDAVGTRDLARAVDRLARLMGSESPLYVVAALERHLRQLLLVKVLTDGGTSGDLLIKTVFGERKPATWMLDKLKRQARGYSQDSLLKALAGLIRVEAELKSSPLDAETALETYLARLLSTDSQRV